MHGHGAQPFSSRTIKTPESKTNTNRSSTRSIVISIFAIIILSVIGSMFASNNHSMMGSTEDPQDGGKVAAAVFGAVAIYAVRYTRPSLAI